MINAVRVFGAIFRHREVVWSLAIKAAKTRYAGTLGGAIWSLVNPVATILVYWFVFSIGFRAKAPSNLPFIILFLCGLIPWLLLSETLINNANAISGNANLVKKTLFPAELLPVVNVGAGLITHAVMLGAAALVIAAHDLAFSLGMLAFLYYLAMLILLALGLSWLFAAINVFYRDLGAGLSVALNVWFWLTPIVWMADGVREPYATLIKFNPMYHIVEGYKAAFTGQGFRGEASDVLYLSIVCGGAAILGAVIFDRLRPEFADVL